VAVPAGSYAGLISVRSEVERTSPEGHLQVPAAAILPHKVGNAGALLMGPDGGFISGSDILMDGGVTAASWYGDLAEVRVHHTD
jgi:hypothetical protein